MKLGSEYVGATTKVCEFEVTDRLAMNYAAAVGDGNPMYFDDLREGGIVLPPAACLAVSWPLSGNFLETWNRDSFPRPFPYELMRQQVHYTETLLLHRIIRPGDKLKVRGEMIAILPHRAGTLLVVRYDATDPFGIPAFTEYVGALLRMVRCTDAGQGADALPQTPPPPEKGEPLWEVRIPIDPLAAHVYDGCTNMYFPIHTSVRFARSVGLKGIILQGAATQSIAMRELTNREAGGDPRRVERVSCTFTGMVIPGTDIVVRLTGRSETQGKTDLFFEVLNQEGRRAISGGYMRLRA